MEQSTKKGNMANQKFNNEQPKQWYIIQKSQFKPPTYFYCSKKIHSKQKHIPLVFGTYEEARQAFSQVKNKWKYSKPISDKPIAKDRIVHRSKPHRNQKILVAVDINSEPKHHKPKQYKSIISRNYSSPTPQYKPAPSSDSEYMQELQRKFEENLKKMNK